MNRRSKEGFVLSALLHGGAVGLAVFVTMFDFEDRDAEKQFELVSLPPLAASAPSGERSDGAPAAERQFDFSAPETVAAPVPVQPSRPPPPTQTKPPPPTPKKPTPTKPPATPTPTPVKPAPKTPPPAPTPAPAMSYDEFVKKHGAPKPTTAKKPSPTTGTPGRTRTPRVDTDFSGLVRESVVGGSRYGSLTGAEMTTLGLYIAEIRGALDDAWPQPSGLADSLSTNVEFAVTADGRIHSMRIVKSSGNAAFDQSVTAAFAAVGRVGPTPDGKPLNLRLTFKLNDM